MPKINREEYKILKGLDDKWKWIARDSGDDYVGQVFAYLEKPIKDYEVGCWWDYESGGLSSTDNHLFQFIQWEDEEPYNVALLLGDYEESQFGYLNNELYERFCEESKEEEVKKSTELLKGEIEKEIRMWDGVEGGWSEEAIDKIFNLIDEFLLSEKGSDCNDK